VCSGLYRNGTVEIILNRNQLVMLDRFLLRQVSVKTRFTILIIAFVLQSVYLGTMIPG